MDQDYGSLIQVKPEGFPPLYKPPGAYFDLCAQGRLLVLSPFAYTGRAQPLTRDRCLATLRISFEAGSEPFAIEAAGAGTDGVTRPPLRQGATYLLAIHDPTGARGEAQTAAFTYDAAKPLSQQLLDDPARFSAFHLTIRVVNSVIRKYVGDFNEIERKKLNTHYGWSLLLCGDENAFQVSPSARKDRQRLILESGGENKITASPLDE